MLFKVYYIALSSRFLSELVQASLKIEIENKNTSCKFMEIIILIRYTHLACNTLASARALKIYNE